MTQDNLTQSIKTLTDLVCRIDERLKNMIDNHKDLNGRFKEFDIGIKEEIRSMKEDIAEIHFKIAILEQAVSKDKGVVLKLFDVGFKIAIAGAAIYWGVAK